MKKKYRDDRIFRILMLISFLCIVTIITFLLIYFLGGTAGNKYGDRLDGMSSMLISDSKIKDIISSIKTEKNVEEVSYNLQGKLYYINIYLVTAGKAIDGVNAATKTLEFFSDEEKKFYDFNFIVTKKQLVSDEAFPIMGSKNSTSTSISWTKY